MAPKREIDGFFTSDLVTLLVGPSATRFNAHKKVLSQARYFAGCLDGNFPEKQRKEIILPEDNPQVVQKLLEFLYFGEIEAPAFTSDVRQDDERTHMALLAKAYIAADKYCMEECQNHITDHFVMIYPKRIPCPEAIAELGSLPKSPLRHFLISKLAIQLVNYGKDYKEILERDSSILQLIGNGGRDAEDLFLACLENHISPIEPALKGCDWHVHSLTDKCKTPSDGRRCDSGSCSSSKS